MQTRVSDIVEKMMYFINALPEVKSGKYIDGYVKAESEITLGKLTEALIKLKSHDVPAIPATVESLKLFLSARWHFIKKTHASYLQSQHSPINLACIELAKLLSPIFQAPVFDLLMPPLESAKLNITKLTELVFSDEEVPIELIACLDKYPKANELVHTSIKSEEGEDLPLSTDERNRIMNHSKEAHNYYLSMLLGDDFATVNEARQKLIEAINNDTCEPNATYGETGDALLIKYIFAEINKSNELINIISKYFYPHKSAFIKNIDNEDLFRLMLDIKINKDHLPDRLEVQKKLIDKFKNLCEKLHEGKMTLFEKERRVKIWLNCVLEMYIRARENGANYSSNAGYVLSYLYMPVLTGVYSETEKLDAANALLAFIADEGCEFKSLKSILTAKGLENHFGPLNNGTLGWLVKEIQKLVNFFINEQTKEASPGLLVASRPKQ